MPKSEPFFSGVCRHLFQIGLRSVLVFWAPLMALLTLIDPWARCDANGTVAHEGRPIYNAMAADVYYFPRRKREFRYFPGFLRLSLELEKMARKLLAFSPSLSRNEWLNYHRGEIFAAPINFCGSDTSSCFMHDVVFLELRVASEEEETAWGMPLLLSFVTFM